MQPDAASSAPATSSDALTAYLTSIRPYRLLAAVEERTLGSRIRQGDEEAVTELVCANLRFVVSVAKRYQNQGVPLADLISEGNVGLIRAAERFDERKGVRFITYAVWWVRQAIVRALAEQSRLVRIPVGRAGLIQRIGRGASRLVQQLERPVSAAEIAESMELSEREVANSLALTRTTLSLDEPLTHDGEHRWLDRLPDDRASVPDDTDVHPGLSADLEQALGSLRPREAKILTLYFGLDGTTPMTLEDIGTVFGITRERVRQIKDRALRVLRNCLSSEAPVEWDVPDWRAPTGDRLARGVSGIA